MKHLTCKAYWDLKNIFQKYLMQNRMIDVWNVKSQKKDIDLRMPALREKQQGIVLENKIKISYNKYPTIFLC